MDDVATEVEIIAENESYYLAKDKYTGQKVKMYKVNLQEIQDGHLKSIRKVAEAFDISNISVILKALEGRSKVLGEEKQPPKIYIEWGLGIDKERLKKIDNTSYKIEGEETNIFEAEFESFEDDDEDDEE